MSLPQLKIFASYLAFSRNATILQITQHLSNDFRVFDNPGFMRSLILSALVLSGVSLTLIADIFLKRSGARDTISLFLGVVLYACVAFPVAIAFRLTEFGELFIIWEAATVIAGVILAAAVYGEELTLQKLGALIMVLIALFMVRDH